jgi:hypothetical protein
MTSTRPAGIGLSIPGSAVRSHMELAGRGFSLVRDSRDAAGGAADPKL